MAHPIKSLEPGVLSVHGKRHKGRVFQVQGSTIECFRPHTLAAALHKTAETIKDWEKTGLIPKPVYRVTGKSDRFYSKEQIVNIYNVWTKFPHGKGRVKPQFFDAVKAVFYKKEILHVAG